MLIHVSHLQAETGLLRAFLSLASRVPRINHADAPGNIMKARRGTHVSVTGVNSGPSGVYHTQNGGGRLQILNGGGSRGKARLVRSLFFRLAPSTNHSLAALCTYVYDDTSGLSVVYMSVESVGSYIYIYVSRTYIHSFPTNEIYVSRK